MNRAYLYVLAASVFWVVATQFYSYVGKQMPIKRLALIKAVIAFSVFTSISLATSTLSFSWEVYWPLLLSGALGFGIGDLFLFYALSHLGPAKTMMLNTFQPFLIAILGYIILGIEISNTKIWGIVFLALCIFFLSRDKDKGRFSFTTKLVLGALLGIFLDGLGLVLSKMAFERSAELSSMNANAIRIFSACIVLALVNKFHGHPLSTKGLDKKDIKILLLATLLGNCFALFLYLQAISLANPAVIAALGGISPVLASAYEHFKVKAYPSPSFIVSIICMLCGIALIAYD